MSGLNGATQNLAEAFRGVILEVVEPLEGKIEALAVGQEDLKQEIKRSADTTNTNVQKQLAAHRKEVAGQLKQNEKRVTAIATDVKKLLKVRKA